MDSQSVKGRIPMLERDEVTPEVGALYDKLLTERGTVPNMFKTVANVPALAAGFAALLKPLMGDGALPAWYKELIATRVAALNNCEYCVLSHRFLAKLRGANDAQIDAASSYGDSSYETGPFTEAEKAGFRYADLLHAGAQAIDDVAYAGIKHHYGNEQVIELTAVAAAFEFFPRFVSALAIPVTPVLDLAAAEVTG